MFKRKKRHEPPPIAGIHRRPLLPTAPGTVPGFLQIPEDTNPTRMRVLAYGPDGHVEKQIEHIEEIDPFLAEHPTTWLTVDGYSDEATMVSLAAHFRLHRLILEDVVNGAQRAKIEPYSDHCFIVARIPAGANGCTRQVSFILTDGCLIMLVDRPDEWSEPVRERIVNRIGRIHQDGPDYLLYAILDTIIDSYYPIIETLGERLERLETEVLRKPSSNAVHRIHATKRTLLRLRRSIWPHREMVNALLRDTNFLNEETQLHIRDCYDHLVRLAELIETLREVCTDLMNTYLSSLSNRMNEVMKFLTIIATIFIPLSFIAGLYGMNFRHMPELTWSFGYPMAAGAMIGVATIMLVFFWRKGWFD